MALKLNDSEKRKNAIEYLKKIGFIFNYSDFDLYHGRVKKKDELDDWKVEPNIDNSHSKNRDNIMAIPCLCVASHDIAEAYASGTSLNGQNGEMQIHEIVSLDDESLMIDEGVNINKLTQNQLVKFYSAIRCFSKGVLGKYCKSLDDIDIIKEQIKANFSDRMMLSVQDESEILSNLKKQGVEVKKEDVEKVVGTINTYNWFNNMPLQAIETYLFALGEKRTFVKSGGFLYRQNQELVKEIFDANNIIAVKRKNPASASKTDNIVYVFNLEKVQTAEKVNSVEM